MINASSDQRDIARPGRGLQAVILAGGRGTRLNADPNALPKPLTPLCGLSVLAHILGRLATEGVSDVVLCTGYRAESIEQALGDGSMFGLHIVYCVDPQPLGTAGAVKAAIAHLHQRFIVAYGDVVFDVDLAAMMQAHTASGATISIAVHPNDHPFDSDRAVADANGLVQRMVRKEDHAGRDAGALCSAALYVMERAALDHVPEDGKSRDFARDVFPSVIAAGQSIFAYRTTEYLADMGTSARRARVESDISNAIPQRMRRSSPRPALMVDRDGVLVEDRPYIKQSSDLILLPDVSESLARLNRARMLTVCCTNQPVIARGEISEDGLHSLHRYLEGCLGEQGAWLDGIFVCPHHTDGGYPGERKDLKIACTCRKPLPGLLFEAQIALGIDFSQSIFVGDRTADLQAARAAGVLGVGVMTGAQCKDGKFPIAPEVPLVKSLREAVALMLDTSASWKPWLTNLREKSVITLGGPSRSGKTVAANALRLALHGVGVKTQHLSLDRFIVPRSQRNEGAAAAERNRLALAQETLSALFEGKSVLVPGYNPRTRERGASEVWQRRPGHVVIVDGLFANMLELPNAFHIALTATADDRTERRLAFYQWKGLAGDELANAVHGRDEEEHTVLAAAQHADLQLTLDREFILKEAS